MKNQSIFNQLPPQQTKTSLIASSQGRISSITQSHSLRHTNKIEADQKKSILSHQHYLIDDSDYNSMIFQWRKSVTAPIAKVFEISRMQTFDEFHGQKLTTCTVEFQKFEKRLSDYDSFTREQAILIIGAFLDAHQAIYKKMGATSISLDKSGINKEGEVKVWINKELDRNQISGELLTTEQKIIQRIIDLIEILGGRTLDSLKSYMNSIATNSKIKHKKRTFTQVKGMLKSYIQCLRIKVPKNLKQKKIKIAKSTLFEEFNDQNPFVPRMTFSIRNRTKSSKGSCNLKIDDLKEPKKNCFSNKNFKYQFLSPKATSFKNNFESAMISINNKRSHTSSDFSSSKKITDGKRRKPSISINGNFIKDLDLQESVTVRNRNTVSTHFVTSPQTKLKRNRSNSFERRTTYLIKQDCIKEDNTPRNGDQNINEILIKDLGFTSLPQVYHEDESNSSINSSAQKPAKVVEDVSTPHFNAKRSSYNSKRQSGISTTNNSSTTHFLGFGKKCKQSNVTINLDERDDIGREIQCRSATQKARQSISALGGTESKKSQFDDPWNNSRNKIVRGSHCENLLTIHNILMEAVNETAARIREEKLQSIKSINDASLETIIREKEEKQNLQSKILIDQNDLSQLELSKNPSKNQETSSPTWNRRPLNILTELITENETESYENTEYSPSKGNTSKRSNVQDHMLQLLKMNKKLVISTYMQSESQKKIKYPDTPPKTEQQKVKQITEGLSDLFAAKLGSQKIISNHDWTKKLENLLQLKCTEVKESFIEGPEVTPQPKIYLRLLETHGRDIGVSQFPQ